MIAAALAALPIISQVGQGLINGVSQDVSNIFGTSGSSGAGQNVPAAGSSGSANSTQQAPAPSTVAQHLSSSMLHVLTQAQTDLDQLGSFAGGQGSISKSQFEAAAQNAGSAVGQSPAAATHAADEVFNTLDSSGTGQISSTQLGSFLNTVQSQAISKYQAAESLMSSFAGGMQNLLPPTVA